MLCSAVEARLETEDMRRSIGVNKLELVCLSCVMPSFAGRNGCFTVDVEARESLGLATATGARDANVAYGPWLNGLVPYSDGPQEWGG